MKRFARRDWGWWLVLYRKPKFKIKLLCFKKGQSLSMQRHQHRNELWLFLRGSGRIYNSFGLAAATDIIKKGNYVLIEKNRWHKYTANRRTLVLEVQYGQLCCETDIERKDGS